MARSKRQSNVSNKTHPPQQTEGEFMDGILMSSRPKGWPRHAYQKRAGAIFFGFVAMFAAWFIESQFEWDGMQRYYLAHCVVASAGWFNKYLVLHTVDRRGKWHPTVPAE